MYFNLHDIKENLKSKRFLKFPVLNHLWSWTFMRGKPCSNINLLCSGRARVVTYLEHPMACQCASPLADWASGQGWSPTWLVLQGHGMLLWETALQQTAGSSQALRTNRLCHRHLWSNGPCPQDSTQLQKISRMSGEKCVNEQCSLLNSVELLC